MFPSISKLCLGLAITTGCLLPVERLSADDWSDVDVDDRVLQIETTDIDDMVYVAINPFADDELAIHILHFVSSAPSLDFQSLEQAIAAADDYRFESRRLDRIDEIFIDVRGGNDVVVVEQDLAIPATVFGGPGDDYISGGAADDFLFGDSPDAPGGEDTILGNRGNDWLDGGDADDLLRGGFGEDELFGGNGDDDLRGEHDADALYGGPGNDSLEGGFDGEQDLLEGGRGVDTFFSKYIKLVWKYRKRYNRLTRQWEYSKTKTPEILEADTVSDLDTNAGDQVKATIIEG